MFSLAARSVLIVIAAFGVAHVSASNVAAQKKSAPAGDNIQVVVMEVAALQTLHRLDLTDVQLEALARLAKGAGTADKSIGLAPMKVTPAFTKALATFRDALVSGDDDKIDDTKEKLAEIMEKDKIALDDRVAITDQARRNATLVIRALQPNQVLAYLQIFDEDEVDLLEILESALDRSVKATPSQWKATRDLAAVEGAWLIAGGDEARHKSAVKMLTTLLDQHHGPKSSKAKVPDLEKQVQQMLASLDPFVILRNAMEREVAEMLSNPRLSTAIQHTLEQRKKVAAK